MEYGLIWNKVIGYFLPITYFYKKSEKILSYTICRHKAVQFINIKDKNPCSKPVLMNFASILLNLTLY